MSDYFSSVRAILALPQIGSSPKVVLLYLFDRQGGNSHSWPSITAIENGCGLTRPTVAKALSDLRTAGLIEVSHPEKPSVSASNRYSVNMQLVKTLNRSTGKEAEPVKNLNQSKTLTGTGKDPLPELVKNLNPNESVNDSHNDPKDIYGDFVRLSKAEHAKLVERFGEDGTKQRIDALDHYIGSSGRKYRSHYHTILAWEKNDHDKPNHHNRTEPHRDYSRQAEYHGGVVVP